MIDEDEDIINEEIEYYYLPNQLNNEDNEADEVFISITDDMLDPTNPELTYRSEEYDTDEDVIPASVQHKFSGILDQFGPLQLFIILIHIMNGKI
jgi:hypothetical protein